MRDRGTTDFGKKYYVKSLPAVFSGCLVVLAVAAVFLLCEAARQRNECGENPRIFTPFSSPFSCPFS